MSERQKAYLICADVLSNLAALGRPLTSHEISEASRAFRDAALGK